MTDAAPTGTTIREVSKLIDLVPALTPKLIELGRWIAGYYLAPIGEVFRAMMPPVTELTARRELVLTEAGRALAEKLQESTTLTDLSAPTRPPSCKNSSKKGNWQVGPGSWGFRPRGCNACSGAATCKFRRRCRDASARLIASSRGKVSASKLKKSRSVKRKSGCARCCKPSAARFHCHNS